MNHPSEEYLVQVVADHYATIMVRPTPLKALKAVYGPQFRFESLGYGQFAQWMKKHRDRFQTARSHNPFNQPMPQLVISEEELLADIDLYLGRYKTVEQRKNLPDWLNTQYGDVDFSSLGHGSLYSFLSRHNIDLSNI